MNSGEQVRPAGKEKMQELVELELWINGNNRTWWNVQVNNQTLSLKEAEEKGLIKHILTKEMIEGFYYKKYYKVLNSNVQFVKVEWDIEKSLTSKIYNIKKLKVKNLDIGVVEK